MATPRKIPPRIEPNAEIGADCCLKQFSLGLELISRSELKCQEVIIFKGSWACEPVGWCTLGLLCSVYTGEAVA